MGKATVDIVQSAFWMTNTGVITSEDGSVVLVDPGVFPHELAAIAERIGERRLLAAISTHEDWDHVLWSDDFPTDTPRLAHPETVRVLEDDRAGFLHSLATWEAGLGETWDHDLVGRLQPVRVDPLVLGDMRIRIIPTPGHTVGHASVWLEDEGVLFAGDMLSDVDIPMLADAPGAVEAYRRSLDTLEPLLNAATLVVPGHGTPCDRAEACRRLALDRAYLRALTSGEPVPSTDERLARTENADAHRQNTDAMMT